MANRSSAQKLLRTKSTTIRDVDDAVRDKNVTRLRCLNKDRAGWTALARREGSYAIGRLYQGVHVVRYAFRVKVDTFNCFQVDIGTGSGVKVKFQFGEVA